MGNITFTVNKSNVYQEVAKTSSYSGAKMSDDNSAYERIFTTDEDRMMLERFWSEACNAVTELMKPFLARVSANPESHGVELGRNYEAEIVPPGFFDETLSDSIGSSLFSFFTNYIVGKWYGFTNKQEAKSYLDDAASMIDDVRIKLYYRKKPKRTVPVKHA